MQALLGMALLAAHTQEALLQSPAVQVGIELLLNELWKRPVSLGAQLAKCRIVLLDELIQQRRLGVATCRKRTSRKLPFRLMAAFGF
jgi:hypothetical protein